MLNIMEYPEYNRLFHNLCYINYINYWVQFKDTSTIPFLAKNYSELVKYSDKIHWKYFLSNLVPMTSSAKILKIFILPSSNQWEYL